jgi:hypothetical protein
MAAAAKKKTAAKKTTARKAAGKRGTAPKAHKAPQADPFAGAARKAAEFLGMDPNDAEARADKLREQTQQATVRFKEEMGRLGKRADQLSARFDEQVKVGMKKFERYADDMAKGLGLKQDEFAHKLENGLDRWGKEASKVADEANTEIKKMYEQARSRLKDLFKKE